MVSQRHQTSWKKVLLSLPNADQSQRGKERPAEASTALSTPPSALVSKDSAEAPISVWTRLHSCLQGWRHSAGHGSRPLPRDTHRARGVQAPGV